MRRSDAAYLSDGPNAPDHCNVADRGGGLLYTVGTYFFSRPNLPYQNAIWHCFVLAASTCFFGAISLSATA
ncbi:MAG: hypothetical protein ABJ246_12675 [Paracoccaceae bacterium]